MQGLEDVTSGLNNLGAQLSLGFRQVAHSLGQLLPPELNPFVEEYEYSEVSPPPPWSGLPRLGCFGCWAA